MDAGVKSQQEDYTAAGPSKQQQTGKRALQPPSRLLKKKSSRELAEEAYGVMQKLVKEKDNENHIKDEFDVFGAHVACQLRNLNTKLYQIVAKQRISQVLYDMEMEQFHDSSSTSLNASASNSPFPEPTSQNHNDSQLPPNESEPKDSVDPTDAFINIVLNNVK